MSSLWRFSVCVYFLYLLPSVFVLQSSNPSAAPLALCARFGCVRPCARNARTLTYHQFCSLRCSRAAKMAANTGDTFNLDLVIALEMSRLQMIEDELKRHQQQVSSEAEYKIFHFDILKKCDLIF